MDKGIFESVLEKVETTQILTPAITGKIYHESLVETKRWMDWDITTGQSPHVHTFKCQSTMQMLHIKSVQLLNVGQMSE